VDNQVRLWDLRSGQLYRSFIGHVGTVSSVQFDDQTLVSGSFDGTMKVWDMRAGRLNATLNQTPATREKQKIRSIQFLGSRLVAGCGKVVKVWNLKSRQLLYELEGPTADIIQVKFDDKKIVAAGEDKRLWIWNFAERMNY